VTAVKTSLDKICGEKEKQVLAFEEIRLMLGQQLKELIAPTASQQPTTNH
jgi:hypothetical protein